MGISDTVALSAAKNLAPVSEYGWVLVILVLGALAAWGMWLKWSRRDAEAKKTEDTEKNLFRDEVTRRLEAIERNLSRLFTMVENLTERTSDKLTEHGERIGDTRAVMQELSVDLKAVAKELRNHVEWEEKQKYPGGPA